MLCFLGMMGRMLLWWGMTKVMLKYFLGLTCALWVGGFTQSLSAGDKLKVLILDGQNNHAVWPKSTVMMRQYLQETGLFEVNVARSASIWQWEREEKYLALAGVGDSIQADEPEPDPDFAPEFEKYDVVVNNFGFRAADWPEATRKAFETYMKNGGGLVVVHAANNCWGDWAEYNKMIGLGGWGGRDETAGPYVYIDSEGEVVREDGPGRAGTHGPASEYVVTMRDLVHPITKGMPEFWMHTRDECYSMMRGPGEDMTILATAADTPALQEAGRNEPMLIALDYHEGRVFHTMFGHDVRAYEGVGFIVTFQRGTEWAATGKVTQEIPEDFPTKEVARSRPFEVKE